MSYHLYDDSGYEVESDFSDYADPGSPIWTPELDGIRDYIDTLAREIVLKRRVAELSRGERSIFPAIPPKKNGNYLPCHFRRHMKGVILEVYGYGLNLAEKDPEGFFWSGFENLRVKSTKRVRVRGKGERKTRKKPYHTRARTKEPYSERQIHRAVEALVKEGLFTPAVRIRRGVEQHGWIVTPHDKFSTLVTYGGHQYCVPEPFGTVAKLYEQVRIGRLDISGLVSAIWDFLDKEIEKKIDQKLAKSAQTLHTCCKDAANPRAGIRF